jgi:mono/diheme cytochrome c family protein
MAVNPRARQGRSMLVSVPLRLTTGRRGGFGKEKAMKSRAITRVFAFGAMAALATMAFAAEPSKLGQYEFMNSCAVCHGEKATGFGAFGGMMTGQVPDLTTLQRRNGGVFPFERVYETIDGTNVLKAHGTREMPIWGQRYRVDAAKYFVDMPYDERAFVRARILALTEYLSMLQTK